MLRNDNLSSVLNLQDDKSDRKRKYDADKQRRFRKNRKAERKQLLERNHYLENLNPTLRQRLELLRKEYIDLSSKSNEIDKEPNLLINMKYNKLLKQQLTQYRNYRSSLYSILNNLNKESMNQNLDFLTQKNLLKLLKRLNILKTKKLSQLKNTIQLSNSSTADFSKTCLNMFQEKTNIQGHSSSITKVDILNLPIKSADFFRTFLTLWEDKSFTGNLIKSVFPDHYDLFAESFKAEKQLVSQENVVIRTASGFGSEKYYLMGNHVEGSTFTILASLTSDYSQGIDNIRSDPVNTHAYVFSPGVDENYCNLSVYSHIEQVSIDEYLNDSMSKSDFQENEALRSTIQVVHSVEEQILPHFVEKCVILANNLNNG